MVYALFTSCYFQYYQVQLMCLIYSIKKIYPCDIYILKIFEPRTKSVQNVFIIYLVLHSYHTLYIDTLVLTSSKMLNEILLRQLNEYLDFGVCLGDTLGEYEYVG